MKSGGVWNGGLLYPLLALEPATGPRKDGTSRDEQGRKPPSLKIWIPIRVYSRVSRLRFQRFHAILQLVKRLHFLLGEFAVEYREVVKQANIVHTEPDRSPV